MLQRPRLLRTKLCINNLSHLSVRKNCTLAVRSYDNESISIVFDGKQNIRFNNVFLRDACQRETSVDPYSKQKLFTTSSIATNLAISGEPKVLQNDHNEEYLQVEWDNGQYKHISTYPKSFLLEYSTLEKCRSKKFFDKDRLLWDNAAITNNIGGIQTTYSDFFNKRDCFPYIVKKLNKFGMFFVNDIPDPTNNSLTELNEENSYKWPVAELASKFGYLKKTFYGTCFNVKTEKQARNIANTNTFLPLHMDLLYYESPPGLQLLHFIRNSTLGGENLFCDSFLAANYIKEIDPLAYEALTIVPITYHYDNNNEFYYFSRPLIVEENSVNNHVKVVKEVNYSAPFQGPFEFGVAIDALSTTRENEESEALFRNFLRGFKLFEDFINHPKNQFKLKMAEGSCVIFDNRRILHSRLEFSNKNAGERWLMGCYVDGDSYRSKLRLAHREFPDD